MYVFIHTHYFLILITTLCFIYRGYTAKEVENVEVQFWKRVKKRKTSKSGSGATKCTPYIYFSRLLFLKSTVRNKETKSSLAVHNTVQLEIRV